MSKPSRVRHQVFVSSTYIDLVEEREEVIRALLELDCIPAGMELFPATNDEQLDLIKQVIDDCDYYVVIIGGRYGSVNAEGVSYTEQEFDYALSKGIPVLAFVHGNPENIPLGKSEPDKEARGKLAAFKEKVQSNRLVKRYTTSSELGGYVSRSLVQEIKRNPRPGWVRADDAVPPETVAELNGLRKKLADLESTVESQLMGPPPGTENLSQDGQKFDLRWNATPRPSIGTFDFDVQPLSGVVKISWNDLLGVIGPLMLDEAREMLLERQLKEEALERVRSQPKYSNVNPNSFSIVKDDFQAVKMQFYALGLIAKSQKKRTASDTATYWSLTPYGERKLVELRAIKK